MGRLGHPDPGLPGAEAALASAPTSAGRGSVPHGQVDFSFKLFLNPRVWIYILDFFIS
jgi:hypothetical protein